MAAKGTVASAGVALNVLSNAVIAQFVAHHPLPAVFEKQIYPALCIKGSVIESAATYEALRFKLYPFDTLRYTESRCRLLSLPLPLALPSSTVLPSVYPLLVP